MGRGDHNFSKRFTAAGNRLTLLFLLAFSVDMQMLACAGPSPITRPVCGRCEDEGRFVRLAQREAAQPGTSMFGHPLHLRPEEWRSLLSGIFVQKRSKWFIFLPTQKGPAEPAFAPEEIDYLSPALSMAFDQVRPDEWVVFGLSRPSVSGVSEVTTGVCFVQDGHLHVRFANYRYAVSMQPVRELIRERPLEGHEIVYDLIPGPHQVVITEPEGLPALAAKPVELMIAYRAALADPPLVQPLAEPQRRHQPHDQPGSATIEERLRTLKRLKEEGLLTEDEYRIKRRQMLEQF